MIGGGEPQLVGTAFSVDGESLLGHELPTCIHAPQQAQTWRVSDDNIQFTTRQPGHSHGQWLSLPCHFFQVATSP